MSQSKNIAFRFSCPSVQCRHLIIIAVFKQIIGESICTGNQYSNVFLFSECALYLFGDWSCWTLLHFPIFKQEAVALDRKNITFSD